MSEHQQPKFRSIHRALADSSRVRLLEALWRVQPQSAKELAAWVDVPADRLYYHLAQLEKAGLIEIAEYRPLPGGKVERMYRPTTVEPPGDTATPLEVAQFLNTMLEATQIDITAASVAKEGGERRVIHLSRTTLRVSEAELTKLRDYIQERVRTLHDNPDEDGAWARVVVTFVDLEDRDQRARTHDPTEFPS